MRVIGGIHRSRRLRTLGGLDVRPTSDRLRETLFNVLGPGVRDSRFLDLCAGSGAVGIEALSRGARQAVFVDHSRAGCSIIEANLKSLALSDRASVIRGDVLAAVRQLSAPAKPFGHNLFELFDYIFLDPPYDSAVYSPVIGLLGETSLLAPAGMVIAEHRPKSPLQDAYGNLTAIRLLKQGDSALTFYSVNLKSEQLADPHFGVL